MNSTILLIWAVGSLVILFASFVWQIAADREREEEFFRKVEAEIDREKEMSDD